MQKKFVIWLQIVTICLCICIITTGIYSLTSAQLTISGSLGYIQQTSILSYDDTGYFIEMGEYEGTKLRWYPFAKLDSEGNVIEKVADSTLDNTQELKGTYYFISEKVLAQSAFNESGYTGNKSDNYGLDYNGSTIQQYLTTTLLTELSISSSRAYQKITARDLPGENYTYSDQNSTTTYTTNDTLNQKLWLLNESEVKNNLSTSWSHFVATDLDSSTNCYWWVRFHSTMSLVAYLYDYVGGGFSWKVGSGVVLSTTISGNFFSGYEIEYGIWYIRPAFQITIS